MSSLHPLDPEIVAETDAWFYEEHPRGEELRGPDGDTPLDPNNPDDEDACDDWVEEYLRRLEEKEAGQDAGGEEGDDGDDDSDDVVIDDPNDEQGGTDPLDPCVGCCPTDFIIDQAPRIEVGIGETEGLSVTDDPTHAGAGTFTWTSASDKLTLNNCPHPGPQVAEGQAIDVVGFEPPNEPPETGELVECTRTQEGCAPITKEVYVFVKQCKIYHLTQPKIIARAINVPNPVTSIVDPALPGALTLELAQDALHEHGRDLFHGPSQGSTEVPLHMRMLFLLHFFASSDPDDKAGRLFRHFLANQDAIAFWSDGDLTTRVDQHANINSWISLAMNTPISPETSGNHRIHQALKTAGWDINAMTAPTDLGTPAVNLGWKKPATEDFANGLGVMINDFTHVVAVATSYYYDQCKKEYEIEVDFYLYDVFGLDDGDLVEYGADGGIDSDEARGITAWWQLQHQHNYAPPITKVVISRSFTVPAT